VLYAPRMSDIDNFIVSALEASIFVAPRDHGLTSEELVEVGQRLNFRPGELNDAIVRARNEGGWAPRLRIQRPSPMRLSADFNMPQKPDFRDIKAFEFVRTELVELAREVGAAGARLSRDILVERGAARGLDRQALEVAITVTVLDGILEEKDGLVGHPPGRLQWVLPTAQLGSSRREQAFDRPWLAKSLPLVQDVIARRTDGRPAAANPLDAFEGVLAKLEQDRFRAWWVQKRGELRLLEPARQPVAVIVLGAALVEAALSFVVPRAQAAGLMKSIDRSKPRLWRFPDLVKGAKSSDPAVRAILDERSAQRCLELNDARQRIHAGFLIDTVPNGPIPDLKPEQARDAVQTVDLLVRKVIEWLDSSSGAPAG
jgi:hypothetical protein